MKDSRYRYVKRPIKIQHIKVKKTKVSKKKFLIDLLPIGLCVLGVTILLYALFPYVSYFYDTNIVKIKSEKEILNPSVGDMTVLGAQTAINNDPTLYYKNAAVAIESVAQTVQKAHPEYGSITGSFGLTIDKISLKAIPTTMNVESGTSTSYLEVLKSSLAHFKGSSIPGKPGNTVVYGHSARGNIFGTTWESMFSGLKELDVGDIIKLSYNGVEYKYSVSKWKITSPDDTSILLSTSDAQVLTLFTCYPAGIANQRLIITADRVF